MAQSFDKDLNIIQSSSVEIQLDPLTKDLSIIQKLDDEPNDVGGLTAQELKAKFDEAGNAIKDYINDSLIPQVLGDGLSEQARQENEAKRQAAESAREAAETAREASEALRGAAETARETAETARAAAEAARAARFEEAQAGQESRFAAAQTERETAFQTERADRESRFVKAQEDQEERFSVSQAARDFWEDYDPLHAYVPGNKVFYSGSSYVNIAACVNVPPGDAGHWQMIARKGADGADALSQDVADQRYLLKPVVKTFSASDWSDNGTISIPFHEHGRDLSSGAVVLSAYMLVDGAYIRTWAAFETYVTVEQDNALVLHYPAAENGGEGYTGRAVIVG